MDLPFYFAEIDPDITSDLEVNFIGLVERPAIEKNFMAFKNVNKAAFVINEEKRIISGPAMIADMPLYRKDDKMGEYYVIFDKKSIRTIVEKFCAKGYLKNFNLFHDEAQQVTDVTIFNSFISDADLGVKPLAGFEDTTDGSWFMSAKVNNDAVWQKVKAGEIKGFSIEGLFTYVPRKVLMTKEQLWERIENMIIETVLTQQESDYNINSPELIVGDMVTVIPGKEHMPEHAGIEMTIAEIKGNAYALKLPDGSIHKWYTADELQLVSETFGGPGSGPQGGGSGGDSSTPSNATPEEMKATVSKLRNHLNLLHERLLSGGLKRNERKLIEKRAEKISGDILTISDQLYPGA